MATGSDLRVRRSLTDIQNDYDKGNKKPLEDLMRAWKGIKALGPDDPNSFFAIGGLHGEPFRGAGWGSSVYWGGYCNHGNILFPTWHRLHLLTLENALRSIPGCEDVTMPYWDETSPESAQKGLPAALVQQTFKLDGQTIDNPLRSFKFPRAITDFINGDNPNYSKPRGYETVRYPLSGLVGTPDDIKRTKAHNAQYADPVRNVKLLNQNVINWLTSQIVVNGKPIPTNTRAKYISCLDAPNYTVFSNTSSAGQWNNDLDPGAKQVVPLESPHNDIHLAIGGFDVPNQGDFSPIPDANGDMGENDTAGLDPIFFFHHCFIDRLFWLWQQRHQAKDPDQLEIKPHYPGTNSVSNQQGPTPGQAPNIWLDLQSPLDPFKREDGEPYTSRDCANIEKQLGYTYAPGSLEEYADADAARPAAAEGGSQNTILVRGLNRAAIRGSFLVSAYATIDGKRQQVGRESVLSRWSVEGCANCQTHLEIRAFIGLHAFPETALADSEFDVEVRTRDGVLTQHQMSAVPTFHGRSFAFELR